VARINKESIIYYLNYNNIRVGYKKNSGWGTYKMHKLIKKFYAILFILILFTSVLISQSIASNFQKPSLKTLSTEKISIYRYGPDETIKEIQINVPLGEEQNIQEAIAKKFEELLINDLEIQGYISNNKVVKNISFFSSVTSWGKGLHWQSPFRFRIPLLILLRFRLFPEVKLRYKILGLNVIPRIYCNYMNDKNARTEIETIPTPNRPDKDTIIIEGEHNVTVYGFIGYTFWRGMNARLCDYFNLETGFDGYALAIMIKK